MKLKSILTLTALTLLMSWSVQAQQPYGGCWHPSGIINWSPETDPDAKFNRSTVPLQQRIDLTGALKANANQYKEGKVAACLTMNPMCSQTPSQGANNFIGYNPTYWQYMDVLIWWAGSAGEGIIIPPSAPVTDAAHLSGVKVLGQLFFPPTAFGGDMKWVNEILTAQGSTYPYAKKMYEIAKYFGFDGWFINLETTGLGSGTAWPAWIRYYMSLAKADGVFQEIQWYDCSTTINSNLQELLAIENVSYFANYGSPTAYNIQNQMEVLTKSLGYTSQAAFEKIYFGIECAQGGIDGNVNYFLSCFPSDGHSGSIDLFNPEEPIWKKVVKDLLDTENNCGQTAYSAMSTVFSNEARFWTNRANDPSNVSGRSDGYFPGFGNVLIERSSIQSLPFVSSFSAGLGKYRFVNGEKRGTQDWYHRGMQDILPTWRWWVNVSDNSARPTFTLNWDDAYNVGTSVAVSGTLKAGVDYVTRMYRTKLAIESGATAELAFKGGTADNIELQIGTNESNNSLASVAWTSTTTVNGWTVATADLSRFAGKDITLIALNFKSATTISYNAKLGQIAILPPSYAPESLTVSGLMSETELAEISDLRLLWNEVKSSDFHHYNIYFECEGNKSLVGQTRNPAFYIPKFTRPSNQTKNVSVYVAAVSKDLKEGTQTKLTLNYPGLTTPNVKLKASSTLVKKGEQLTLTATADNYPTAYAWSAGRSAGATFADKSAASTAVSFANEGIHTVTCKVTNEVGTTTETIIVEVNDTKSDDLKIVSVGKTIDSYSSCISVSGEYPTNLIDGVRIPASINAKWCAGGSKEHWVIIDLKQQYQLYKFMIYDCNLKEGGDNVPCYKVYTSLDKVSWTQVLDEVNRGSESRKTDYIEPQIARYVKFVPYNPENAITIRIWEYEVYGVDRGVTINGGEPINDISMTAGDTKSMSIPFDLQGASIESNFSYSVVPNASNITVSNLAVNHSTNRITYTLNAVSAGNTKVDVNLTNGEWSANNSFTAYVTGAVSQDILRGKPADFTYDLTDTYPFHKENVTTLTDGDDNTGELVISWKSADQVNIIFDAGDYYSLSKMIVKSSLKLDKIKVYGSDTFNGEYTLLNELIPTSTDVESFFSGTAKYVKFTISIPYANEVTLSDIELYGVTTGIDDILYDAETVIAYPNPVTSGSEINISGREGDTITFVSQNGAIVSQYKATGSVTSVNVNMVPGTYILNVGDRQTKIVVK